MSLDNQPLVSVVIPCYNHEKFVQDSIQSVIDQTYENIELIIIDDGSKDRSVEKIQEMIVACKKRFARFEFRHRVNKGLSSTLNEALEWCTGEYYSAIASDDMLLPEKIKKQIEAFAYFNKNSQNIVGIFGGYHLIDNDNKIISTVLRNKKDYDFNEILSHSFDLPAPTTLLNLDAVKKVGGYAEDLKIEDWFMWLKLTERGGKLIYIDKIFVNYRSHGNNTSKNIVLMNQERQKVLSYFSEHSYYLKAKSKLEWLEATDYLYLDKSKALIHVKKLLSKRPFDLFSKNFLRFVYHALKVNK
ncbi:glycosyltransferase family 2 protein [Acinetobacter bereziniae]|uniref:glycosyltransferase family 2 protein n=1 Tax=Acinetobacter bereziniae TaxID=106648 RepID=UPI003009A672